LKNVLKKESEVLIPSERELIKHIILSFVVNMLILYKKHHTESDFGDRDLSKDKYMMMDKFVELLEVYHTRERELQFYAEKMCITPKYLSTLVHSITGRKATDWISDFVIIEAKSMLAYSGNNIQEIFYRLNFPTRSAFGKYFKTYVGMTPHRISRKESTLRKNKHIREINQCFPK
jgi:AraC-like DNA-binding protein